MADSRERMIIGIFHDRASAELAYEALNSLGYGQDDVTLFMSDETRARHFAGADTELGNKAREDFGTGAAIGGTVGATLAAISAIGTSIAIPGIGLIVAGPLAAALAGAGVGGATGGLIGALVGSGITESHAKLSDEAVRRGDIVLGVNVRSPADINEVLTQFGTHGTGLGPDEF